MFKLPRIPKVPAAASDLINEVIDEATWRLSRLLFPLPLLIFLPVELFAEVLEDVEGTAGDAVEDTTGVPRPPPAAADVEADVSASPDEATVEPVVKLFLICSKLLLEPADMSLAGPVAEVKEIFSGSNSAGPKINFIFFKKYIDIGMPGQE